MSSDIIARFLESLVRGSAQAGLLIAVVLLVQRLFHRWLAPRWRCGLWLLVVARLLLPVSLPNRLSLFNLFSTPADEQSRADAVPIAESTLQASEQPGSLPGFDAASAPEIVR